MIFLDELEYNKVYRKPFFLPINEKDKLKGSSIFLLTPNVESSMNIMNHPLLINKNYFRSYFIEKDITYYINQEGYLQDTNNLDIITEEFAPVEDPMRPYLPYVAWSKDKKTLISAKFLPDKWCVTNIASIEDYTFRVDSVKGNIKSDGRGCYRSIREIQKGEELILISQDTNIRNSILNESYNNTNNKIYFLSEKNMDGQTLSPRIPSNFLTKNGYEDKTTPRVCFSTSINTALIALSQNLKGKEFYVHVPDTDNLNIVKPSIKQVPDCKITKEVWVTGKVKLKTISLIKVTDDGTNEYEYTYGDNKKATLYDWKWDTVEKFNEHSLSEYLKGDGEELVSDNKGKNIYAGQISKDYVLEDTYLRYHSPDGDVMILFNENLDEEVLNENKDHNPLLNKILYKERLKNNKEVFDIYDQVTKNVPYITKTFLDYKKYKNLNLFVDLFYYNQTFAKNNIYRLDKGVNLYFDFINRFINDKRLENEGYTKKTVFVPIHGWGFEHDPSINMVNYRDTINPLSMILRLLKDQYTNKLKEWNNIDFVILSNKSYIKLDLSKLERVDIARLNTLFDRLRLDEDDIPDSNETNNNDNTESKKAIVANIVDKIEDSQKIKLNNLTGDGGDISKDELIKKIEKAAAISTSTDDAIDKLEDDKVKEIIDKLASEENNNVNINNARLSRMQKLNDEFHKKQIKGKSVKDLLDPSNSHKPLPVTKLTLDTVNDDWEKLQYVNFEEAYNIDEDIMAILESFSRTSRPVSVRDIDIEDTSTSEDYKDTYTVKMEDVDGNRFTIKFDVPKFEDHKFMKLRGNSKTINGQLVLLPISKTDDDTVQIVSNYKKIFIRRYGTSKGKSFVTADRIMKAIDKSTDIKVTIGDNTKICNKYELPIDYIDLASMYSIIETADYKIYFNQDEIRKNYEIDNKIEGFPFAINKKTNDVVYYDGSVIFSYQLKEMLMPHKGFSELYDNASVSSKYTYSQASILSNKIPLILIMAYNEGLIKSLTKANIKYEISEKRPKYDKDVYDIIKFNNGYILYELNYNSSLLLNGLKACNTEDYPIEEMNNKAMYLDFLDLFGGRVLADGLDNFYDLMIDTITEEVLEFYKLPTDYIELLAYGNLLLSDNKYVKHTDMRSNRYRSNEIIAGYVYQSLCEAYEDYRLAQKRGRKATMSMKQSIVLDKVLSDPTCSDQSTINEISDLEAINSVSFKGLAGMNSDRGYSLDKRTFDDSMLNILGLSTGFAGNVGITRQATLDMNIEGKRGYLKINNDTNELNITKTFTATEALTPMGVTRDDPFRSAMTFIQTAKHGMRTKYGTPLLISNGADQALPYLTPNNFAYNAKDDGEVVEATEDYLVLKYKDGTHDYIDLRNIVKKNSNGGFFVSIKLDTNYKQGKKFKKNDIIAYDKLSYSDMIGHTDNIAYNIGVLTKIAMLNTDEGFEDSAIISDWLSEAMASDVVVQKDVMLPKSTNIYNMAKKGQPVQEGDPLLIFQNAFDDEDVNILLKTLTDGDEEMISTLGRIPIKSKITGEVQDIKIYRTVEKEELSDSLRKAVNTYEKPIAELKKMMKRYDINSTYKLDADYKLENTGKLKNLEDGVLIEFYLKYEDKMSVGDKLIYFSALKGVIKDIFPIGKEPYTDFRPNEKIHSLLSQGSVVGRMVCSVELNMAINKILIELDRKVKDMAGIKWVNVDEMISKI